MGGKDIPDLLNADKHSLASRKKTDENKRKEHVKMNEIIQKINIDTIMKLNEEKRKQGSDDDGIHVEADMVQ